MRFFAIMGVLLLHMNKLYSPYHEWHVAWNQPPAAIIGHSINYLFDLGYWGVPLFFVISGFILALPFAKHYLIGTPKPSYGKYILRRLTRLEPPYLICLMISVGVSVLIFGQSLRNVVMENYPSLFYGQGFINQRMPAINPVLWSLEVEVQWYLSLPLFAMMFKVKPAILRRAAFVGLSALLYFAGTRVPSPFLVERGFLSFCQYFFVGCILADVYITNWKSAPTRLPVYDLLLPASLILIAAYLTITDSWASCQGLAFAWPIIFKNTFANLILMPATMLMIYISAFRGVAFGRIVCNRWITTIGGMCYTLYLYHYLIARIVNNRICAHLPATSSQYVSIGFAALVVIIGSGIFVLTEKPFMYRDWPKTLATAVRSTLSQWQPSHPESELQKNKAASPRDTA